MGDYLLLVVLTAAVISATVSGCSPQQNEKEYNIKQFTFSSDHCFGIVFVSYDSHLENKITAKKLAQMYIESKLDNAKEKFVELVLGRFSDLIKIQMRGSTIPMVHPYILYICQCKEKPYNTKCAIESITWHVDKVPVTEYSVYVDAYAQRALDEAEKGFAKMCNCDK